MSLASNGKGCLSLKRRCSSISYGFSSIPRYVRLRLSNEVAELMSVVGLSLLLTAELYSKESTKFTSHNRTRLLNDKFIRIIGHGFHAHLPS